MTETKINYIANQFTPEGIDEVQWLILAHSLKQNAAMAGPPGVGKTELVESLSENLFKNIMHKADIRDVLWDITCDEKHTESPYTGYPTLKGNGGTTTVYEDGVVTNAMKRGAILYFDEFNLLPQSLQKRFVSVFDQRTRIRRRDGELIRAQPGFFVVASYNPTRRDDIENGVADRFLHKTFNYLPEPLESHLALRMAGQTPRPLNSEKRGITYVNESPVFLEQQRNGEWVNFFTGKPVQSDHVYSYDAMPFERGEENGIEVVNILDLSDKLTKFNTNIRKFASTGKRNLPVDIQNYLTDIGEVGNLRLHLPGPRTIQQSIKQANKLLEMGMKPADVIAYATRLAVDQIGYGFNGSWELEPGTGYTVRDAVADIAKSMKLLPRKERNNEFEGR